MSRRRFLRFSALAAVAVPAATWVGRPEPAVAGPARDRWALGVDDGDPKAAYRAAFRAAVAEDKNVRGYFKRGREFLYRPRQLLVAPQDVERVVRRLRELGYQVTVTEGFAGVLRLVFDREVDIPRIVTQLRDQRQRPDEPPPAVQPHHVTVGHDNIMGNPDGPPVAAPPLPDPPTDHLTDGKGVLVGVCDTGIWRDAGAFHPRWLHGAYVPEPDDEDALYKYGDVLALQGGHGTFVAGVLRQAAPGVRFDPEAALADSGIGDEEMLVGAIDRLDKRTSIINLSLGCFTQDDVPPLPIVNRLARLGPDVVVVASAGNAGVNRPSWPAALPDVIAVAAVTRDGDTVAAADYSNFGSWVDACADGERTSTYVTGRLELPGQPPIVFPGFARWAGTSFAAPYVAGRLAAMMTAHGYTAAEAGKKLLAGARWQPDYGVLVG
jgi:subtilisin family serine protease